MKRNRAGFTLVELIIVIAILAILTGVAVPVYSGYIKKANEASDLQLLGAMNTAFSAACAERGVNPTNLVAAAALSGEQGNMTVTGVSAVRRGGAALSAGEPEFDSAALNEAFLRYFGENTDKPFKVYTSLGYDSVNGVFVDGAREYTFATAYGTVTVTAAQLSDYQASTFGALGVNDLTSMVDKLSNKVVESSVSWLEQNEDFQAFWNGLELDTSGWSQEEMRAAKANALVLWAAQASEQVNEAALLTGEGNAVSSLSNYDQAVASSAMMYALMTAYVNSDYAKNSTGVMIDAGGNPNVLENLNSIPDGYSSWDDYINTNYSGRNVRVDEFDDLIATLVGHKYEVVETTSPTYQSVNDYFNTYNDTLSGMQDVSNLYNALVETDGWNNYIANQGQEDLNGYNAAMNMINTNVNNLGPDELATVLKNGFDDPTLVMMLQSILGN
ncbi:MAG: prepilin-type N-terminal cleavage/methylation domain-containing protein [Oscillospiraceae bacterium]|nr:prepilin-type N-terminal cleavage/methylation domain-containing protein [Oscillospiraceae bacterium]